MSEQLLPLPLFSVPAALVPDSLRQLYLTWYLLELLSCSIYYTVTLVISPAASYILELLFKSGTKGYLARMLLLPYILRELSVKSSVPSIKCFSNS